MGKSALKKLPISTIIGKTGAMQNNEEFGVIQANHSEFGNDPEPTPNSVTQPNPSSCLEAEAPEPPVRVIHEHYPWASPGNHSDELFIRAWLSGKSENSKRAYRRLIEDFRSWVHPLALRDLSLHHLLSFLDSWGRRSRSTRALVISALKSCYSFGQKTGFFQVNLAALLPSVQPDSRLTERYLTEDEVRAMIAAAHTPIEEALLRLLYSGGLRVSECVSLNWQDINARESGEAQLKIKGKGDKTRVLLVSPATLAALLKIRPKHYREFDPVFTSGRTKKRRLTDRSIRDIIFRLAIRAGIKKRVSPHWLRHAHASHALDRGAPIHLVQATLGHASVATTGRYLHARPGQSSGGFLSE